jgi:hypothetical protein
MTFGIEDISTTHLIRPLRRLSPRHPHRPDQPSPPPQENTGYSLERLVVRPSGRCIPRLKPRAFSPPGCKPIIAARSSDGEMRAIGFGDRSSPQDRYRTVSLHTGVAAHSRRMLTRASRTPEGCAGALSPPLRRDEQANEVKRPMSPHQYIRDHLIRDIVYFFHLCAQYHGLPTEAALSGSVLSSAC